MDFTADKKIESHKHVRYGYLDALRGVAMLIVVFTHVLSMSIGIEGTFSVFFCTFRLPPFFFISGFFAYRLKDGSSCREIMSRIVRNFKVMIIGASVFMTVNLVLLHGELPTFVSLAGFANGYWFTYTLFVINITFIVTRRICRFFVHEEYTYIVLSIIAILCVYIHINYPFFGPSIVRKAIFFMPFFIAGAIAKANLYVFERLMVNKSLLTFSIISTVVLWSVISMTDSVNLDTHIDFGSSAISYPLITVSLILIINIFYHVRRVFENDSFFSRCIRFIGRRTLDIYFIHYFFLPDLHSFRHFFTVGNSTALKIVFGMVVTLIIVGLSLFVGQVLRMSPSLSEWLLGGKRKDNENDIPVLDSNFSK